MSEVEGSVRWWGEFRLKEGESGYWQVGPMRLLVTRSDREWLVAYLTEREAAPNGVQVAVPCSAPPPMEEARIARFGFRHTDDSLKLSPLLADRPVISRPEVPLFVPPGEEVLLFVGSPLWFRLEANASRTLLQELPVLRPSDTWFGDPSKEGGLCYASSTRALSDSREVVFTPHRAVTPVRIRNRAKEQLAVERLNLPVPFLSLHLGSGGLLWTQSVILERSEEDEAPALLKLGKGAPAEAGEAVLLAPPRASAGQNLVFQAFGKIFG